jgi:hypothetical protein
MGMYTEIYVNVDFKKDIPEDFLDCLKKICDKDFLGPIEGKPQRWSFLFCDMSYYTPNTCVSNLTYDRTHGFWSLLGKGDIKNYENEIEQFFEWIKPWVEGSPGDFIGYLRYEEEQVPTLIFL